MEVRQGKKIDSNIQINFPVITIPVHSREFNTITFYYRVKLSLHLIN
jgi:hypothetical protein